MKRKIIKKKSLASENSLYSIKAAINIWNLHRESVLLTGICVLFLISHTLYVFKTYQYPAWDEHLFLQYSIKFYDILTHPSFDMLGKLQNVLTDRQPVYPFIMTLPLLILGTEYIYKIGLWINGLYYIITIISIYYLAKEFINKNISLLASIIFACYGFPLFYVHFTYSETAATAFVTTSLCFLAKSKYFLYRKYVLLFSLSFALAILTRWTTPIFIIGPLLLCICMALYNIYYEEKKLKWTFINNILLFIFIALILPAAIYYLPKLSYFQFYITHTSANSAYWVETINYLSPELKNTFSVRSIMFYFNILSEQTVYLFAAFVFGSLAAIRYIKKYIFLLLAFFVPYFVFTFVVIFKDDRFIVPIYPTMAIISVIFLPYIKNLLFRNSLVVIILFVSILNLLGGSWGVGPLGDRGLKDIVLPAFIHHPRRIYLTTMVWPPQKDIMNGRKFVSIIENDFGKQNRSPNILMTFRDIKFDQIYSIYTYEKREDYNIHFQQIRGLNDKNYTAMFKSIQAADYISIKSKHTDEAGFDDPMVVRFNTVISMKNAYLPVGFVVLDKVFVPYDKSSVTIYKKKRNISKEELKKFSQLFINKYPEDEEKITLAVNSL